MTVPFACKSCLKKVLSTKTIAILPFVNMSSSSENEYFSDGITEEIINALAQVKHLKVTSRTSSFFFKGKNIPIAQIGQKLGVSTILEGSVRRAGDTIRITAQLIQAKDDYHFWSETWDRKLENIFEIQDEISLLIADRLREHFGHVEIGDHLVNQSTTHLGAYDYCLKARYHQNQWNAEDARQAISFYEKALKLDSNYADAYLGLADSYSFLGTVAALPFNEAWEKSASYTRKAQSLNGQSAGVHFQLSNEAFLVECDYARSLREMKQAIDINPNYADAQQFMFFLYTLAGERKLAKKHLDIALGINPLSEETLFFKAYFYYMNSDFEEALSILNERLAVNGRSIPAHSVKVTCLLNMGQYNAVLNYYDNVPKDAASQGDKIGSMALAYLLKGEKKRAAGLLEELKEEVKGPNGQAADAFLFMAYVLSGDIDAAFKWVDEAIERRSSLVLLRYTDPLVSSLKADSRYAMYYAKLFGEPTKVSAKKKKAPLADEVMMEYQDMLLAHIEAHKPYLNPSLSLRALARQIELHPNQLSWLLNTALGKNFNEFINHYRVEAFKQAGPDPENAHLSVEGLAYECGFNSKTVFNTYFKKETGMTPTQFLKQYR